jgi:probable phosphoglycerate mutase
VTELLLVRHGRPETGRMDPPLSEQGREQARLLGESLRGAGLTAVVSSDLRRARETAAFVADAAAVPAVTLALPGLREWGMAADAMEYVTLEALGDSHPQAVAVAEGRYEMFVPRRVDIPVFVRDVATAFDTVLAEHPAGRVAVVCHGGVINAYVGALVGIGQPFWFHPDYASVSRVVRMPGGRVVLRSLNEVHHLTPCTHANKSPERIDGVTVPS